MALPMTGTPAPWMVRAGVPSAERCRFEASWVATGRAAAGRVHEGRLLLRDLMGNEADGATAQVQLLLREEFETVVGRDTDEPEARDDIDLFYPRSQVNSS